MCDCIPERLRDFWHHAKVLGNDGLDAPLKAAPVPDIHLTTLSKLIEQNVVPGTKISTDEMTSYNALQRSPYEHGTVNHNQGEYVRGIHHTNTIEGHWSLLKRAIRGTHTHVSPKHLWKYVCEFSYRRNMRHSHWLMFDHLLVSISKPLPQAG